MTEGKWVTPQGLRSNEQLGYSTRHEPEYEYAIKGTTRKLREAEAAIARVRGIPEKESDVGYPNDWHIGWNACRESVLDALEEQLTNEVPDSYIQMKARALTAEAAIARVRIEHRSDMAGIPWCYACDASWPCDTIRALDGDSDD